MITLPSLPGIVDLVGLQNAVALVLLADQRLKDVPILTEIKLHMDSDITVDALWTLPRAAIQVKPGAVDLFSVVRDVNEPPEAAGPVGCGLLVEMVQGRVASRNVSGPPLTWTVGVVAFEHRNTNLEVNTGIFIMAEQLAQIVLDDLHQQVIYPYGQLAAQGLAVGPARDWEALYPGIACWRTSLEGTIGRVPSVRSANVAIAFGAGQCTITCPDASATIVYTLDGSAATKANPNATAYTGQFPVDPGTVVTASSWKNGAITSAIVGAVAPNP